MNEKIWKLYDKFVKTLKWSEQKHKEPKEEQPKEEQPKYKCSMCGIKYERYSYGLFIARNYCKDCNSLIDKALDYVKSEHKDSDDIRFILSELHKETSLTKNKEYLKILKVMVKQADDDETKSKKIQWMEIKKKYKIK